ncbi:MAG: DUF2442 domain-containing protein [Proteobacteria bacterium]|jgi:hypothetical protein|nr:DUF2442 domain-containing protein [Pseudomonadota bacterium]
MTTPKLESAEYLDGYRLKITFSDGASGVIDLTDELWGEVFAPLKDLEAFKSFRVDDELSTIVWPTGADLAPEYLYQRCA